MLQTVRAFFNGIQSFPLHFNFEKDMLCHISRIKKKLLRLQRTSEGHCFHAFVSQALNEETKMHNTVEHTTQRRKAWPQ